MATMVSNTKRDASIDTLKFTLMCLVILGHCLETFELHKSPITDHIYQFVYLFHMPLFVFVSGYFMNKIQDKDKFYHGLLFILETYVIFQLPSYILSTILNGIQNPLNILDPTWAMWYLPSLIVWKFIIYKLPQKIVNNKIMILGILVLLSVLGGFVNYGDFAYQRIITYFPMFMAGYYCKQDNLLIKIKQIPVSISIVIITLYLVCLFVSNIETSVVFYQNNSYYTQPISVSMGVLFRCVWYILTFVLSLAILPLLLKIKSEKFAFYGRFTLLFYVCHVFFLNYFRILISKLHLTEYPVLSIVTFAFIIGVLCMLSKSKWSKFYTNPISTIINKKK